MIVHSQIRLCGSIGAVAGWLCTAATVGAGAGVVCGCAIVASGKAVRTAAGAAITVSFGNT